MAKNELHELKNQFLEYLEIERGRSVKTIENYDRYLTRFLAFSKAASPQKISEQIIREFRLHLNRQAGTAGTMKHKTQNYYMISLRAFLKFLRKRGFESLNPERIELAKVGSRDLDLISADELERLMKAPSGNALAELRDRALLELFFSTGLRVSELCALNRVIDLSRDGFSVRGKGEKVRVVFLSPAAKDTIKKYLDKRGDVDEALFCADGQSGENKQRFAPYSPLGRAHREAPRHQGWHHAQSNAACSAPLIRDRSSRKWR